MSVGKDLKNGMVFREFDSNNLIFMENKCHIRNQEAKIYRKLYALTKKKIQ
jgi:hypothetical protein